ncbi:MAG: DUF898 family protein, partial [Alphaproteobacteria bacterium]
MAAQNDSSSRPAPTGGQKHSTAAAGAPAAAVAFTARRWPLAKLLLKNAVLIVVSLGLYWFWARTEVRRLFWAHVVVGGDRLEYVGRGLELFLGFLTAVAVLVPLAFAYFAAKAAVSADGGLPALDLLSFALLFFLAQLATYRVRRYRLAHTVWRGARCGLDGSSVGYALMACGYWLVTLLTLGFFYPWLRVGLGRELMTNVRMGERRFTFKATARDLLGAWLPVFLCGLAADALLLARGGSLASLEYVSDERAAQMLVPALAEAMWPSALALFAGLALYPRYRLRELRCFVGATGLGDTSFATAIRLGAVLKLYAVYSLLFTLGLAVPLGAILVVFSRPILLDTGAQSGLAAYVLLLAFGVVFVAV